METNKREKSRQVSEDVLFYSLIGMMSFILIAILITYYNLPK